MARLERHAPSGMFYNWYDPATGTKLTIWPVDGGTVHPFLSSVDNGWMAAALLMVANAVPQLRDQARDLLAPMDFGWYYDPAAGLLRGGFWVDPPGSTCTTPGNYRDPAGPQVLYTCHHYGALNTEPRIASYLGIAFGQVPATHYFMMPAPSRYWSRAGTASTGSTPSASTPTDSPPSTTTPWSTTASATADRRSHRPLPRRTATGS